MEIDVTPEELNLIRAALAEYVAYSDLGAEIAAGRAPLERARHLRRATDARRLAARLGGSGGPLPAA